MEHKVDRHAMRIICWSSLIITIIIVILQIVIRRRWRYNTNLSERIFYWTLIAIYISHAINTSMNIAFNNGWPSCTTCTDQVVWGIVVYLITRMFTCLFLLQRAQTAQGIQPAVGPKCKMFCKMVHFQKKTINPTVSNMEDMGTVNCCWSGTSLLPQCMQWVHSTSC